VPIEDRGWGLALPGAKGGANRLNYILPDAAD
jgi:hypothetical protein